MKLNSPITDPKVDEFLNDYEEIPKEAMIGSKMLAETYIRLGRPQNPLSSTGIKMMNVIIAIWQDLYPIESEQWINERKSHLLSEMSISSQVKLHTGRSLASFPWPVYQMMKKLFPLFKPQDRKNCIKMVKKFPIFKLVNQI